MRNEITVAVSFWLQWLVGIVDDLPWKSQVAGIPFLADGAVHFNHNGYCGFAFSKSFTPISVKFKWVKSPNPMSAFGHISTQQPVCSLIGLNWNYCNFMRLHNVFVSLMTSIDFPAH